MVTTEITTNDGKGLFCPILILLETIKCTEIGCFARGCDYRYCKIIEVSSDRDDRTFSHFLVERLR